MSHSGNMIRNATKHPLRFGDAAGLGLLVALLFLMCLGGIAHANITIETVAVGDAGNSGYGSVGYTYNIGKYEITAGQYTAFLNAVAGASDTYGLYNSSMWNDTSYGCKIQQTSVSGGGYSYAVDSAYANMPVNYVSFWDSCRFANWLGNGQGASSTETGTYTLNGYNGPLGGDIQRNAGWTYAVTSKDEWYKAAYYTGSGYSLYANGTSTAPVAGTASNYNWAIGSTWDGTANGALEQNGTKDMMGNVQEWNEEIVYIGGYDYRGVRGGSFGGDSYDLQSLPHYTLSPDGDRYGIGFRVVQAVPEPPSLILETVAVGDAGNAADVTGYGSVSYVYNIGKHEITAGQYTNFLNHKAQSDPYALWDPQMADTTTQTVLGCSIQRSGASGSYTYSVAIDYANRPVNYVSFWDACRFANWLGNGQGNSNMETGAYTLSGYNSTDGRTIKRNANWTWAVPSEDEWYKAAYYKGGGTTAGYWDYPTKSDTAPSNVGADGYTDPGNHANYINNGYTIGGPYWRTNVGEFENSPSAYGTFDQGGNVWEWNEAIVSNNSWRGRRGGSFLGGVSGLQVWIRDADGPPTDHQIHCGFRVVQAAPEPPSFIAEDAVSREVSLYNDTQIGDVYLDASSREVSIDNDTQIGDVYLDASSREVSLYNDTQIGDVFLDASSREVSIDNDPQRYLPPTDAISREVSLNNNTDPLDPDGGSGGVVSREVSIVNDPGTVPPETWVVSGPGENSVICDGGATFTFIAHDDVWPEELLQYSWRIDGGAWSAFSNATSVELLDLADGLHKFEVVARDYKGNVDQSPATRNFSVSLLSPTIGTVNSSPSSTQAFISWRTDKLSDSRVEYGLTTAYGQTTTSTKQVSSHVVTVTGLESLQTYHFRVRSTDTCGREGISPDFSFTTLKDGVMPDTRISSGPGENGSSCSRTVKICWIGTDNANPPERLSYSWKMDSGDWSPYAADTCHEFTELTEGNHTFSAASKDTSGNVDSSPAYLHFRVDLSPPVISNISASAESMMATVTWATDEPCSSRVDYGLTDAYGLNSPYMASMVIEKKDDADKPDSVRVAGVIVNNKVAVNGLIPETIYHYRVRSKNACGLETVSPDATFTTTADITPPETQFLSGPLENGSACATTVRFCWTGADNFDPPAQLAYSWKLDTGDWSAYSTETCHDFESLTEGNHTVWVKARDTRGNEDLSPAYRHFRVDLTPPVISNVNVTANATQATATWLTVEGCTSQVEYGLTDSYGSSTSLDSSLISSHRVTISGLNGETTYHYRVKSKDFCGQETSSGDRVFATTADSTGPDTSIFSGPSEGSALCSTGTMFCWFGTDNVTAPDQLQFAWKMDGGPWSGFSSELCHEFTGLSEGNHTFAVSARDSAGNEDPSPVYRHFRVDLSPPEISAVSASVQANQATIKWATIEPCNSIVEYGASSDYGSTTPVDNSMVTSHRVVLAALEPESTYHYRVKSKDSCGMETASADYTFTTVADTQPPDTRFTSGPADQGKACEPVAQFCWAGSDNVTPTEQLAYSYNMDNGGWSEWSPETCADFPNLSEGLHTMMVKARDLGGNVDQSPAVRYFFVDLTPTTISTVGATTRDTSASIAWNTSEPANSQVEYGNTPEYGYATSIDQAMVGKHDVALRGLSPESTYHYRVKSSDGCREVVSDDYTFVTTATQYPNLRIADVLLKGTCIGLQKIGFAWLVHNDGPGSAPGGWTDKVFLSTDDTLDGLDILLGTFGSGGSLDWASERWQNVTLDMPMASPGSYYLIVKTDYDNTLSETNEDDNVQARRIDYLMVKQLTGAPDEINIRLNPGDTVSKDIALTNLGEFPLTGLTATVEGGSPNVNIVVSAPESVGGLAVQKVGYAVSAVDESVQQCSATVKFTTAEGPEVSVKFNITVSPRYPKLVVTPNYLETGMVKGSQALVEFEVMNQGAVAAKDLKVLLPSADWLSLVTPDNIGELGAGETVKVGLALKPTDKTALGPYTGTIGLSATNGGASVNFKFIAVSEDIGSLKVRAEDEFTYYADGKPALADATVKLTNPYDGTLVAEGRTDSSGNFTKDGLKEGFYNVEVTADRHATYKGSAKVEPGQAKTTSAFLPRQLVTYTWKVEPVQTEDHYVVTLEAVFETHVPAPVVTVDPMVLDLRTLEYDAEGKATVNYTITNQGLIAAKGLGIRFGSNAQYEMTALAESVGEVAAMSSITVPVRVRKTGALAAQVVSLANENNMDCGVPGVVDYYYVCKGNQWQKVPLYALTDNCPETVPNPNIFSGMPPNPSWTGGESGFSGAGPVVINLVPPPNEPNVETANCCPIPPEFDKCTSRHPRPGWNPAEHFNGCGGEGHPLQNNFFDADFTVACNLHDICYSTCNSDRAACDWKIFTDGCAACDNAYPVLINPGMNVACKRVVLDAYILIRAAGWLFYEPAQRDACCCDERTR